MPLHIFVKWPILNAMQFSDGILESVCPFKVILKLLDSVMFGTFIQFGIKLISTMSLVSIF